MKKERKATYTVKIPIQFTFCANNDLDVNELHEVIVKEVDQRLKSGYFDVLSGDWDVVKKVKHYTREEMQKQKQDWEEILRVTVPNVENSKPILSITSLFKRGQV